MSLLRLIHIIMRTVACATLLAASAACTDDTFDDMPDYTVSGKPVTLSVKLQLPEMEAKSRADLPVNDINRVQTLWVRTYSSVTKKATSDWTKLTPGTVVIEDTHDVTININTLSGYNYIVGVANVDNKAILKSNPDEEKTLAQLLENADTWDDFLDIAVVSPSTFNTMYAPSVPLPMAGCYVDINPKGTHPTALSEWQEFNFTPHFIPVKKGVVEFQTGAIHLRRLVSQVTFNFIPGDKNFDLTVNSYTIYNAPKYSWVYERGTKDGMTTNFGDAATESTTAAYFAGPIQYTAQYISKDDKTGTSTFNYWQGESKHTGSATKYTDRDACSGNLFTSLTGSAWTPNNMASYVRVQCTIAYKGTIKVDSEGATDKGGNISVHRVGNADYIIHLGNIGGIASDFNCYRNTRYTYNVTVNGVNDIRVDAYRTDELYPGEEGIVSDMDQITVELDSHYNTYNVQLTESELKQPNFGFLLTTYYGGVQRNVDESNYTDYDSKFYDWVELRPTTGRYVLAEYKPKGYRNDNKTFLLADLVKGTHDNAWDNMQSQWKSESGWYTVFVKENTYESSGNETTGATDPTWRNYVNQNPRRCYIRVTRKISPDGNSVYARSKYGISQRSIQTYYSEHAEIATAIGMESFNETEGLNMRSSFTKSGTSDVNGRYNMALWLGITDGKTPDWSTFIVQEEPLEVPAVNEDRAQGGAPLPDRTITSGNPAPMPRPVSYTKDNTPTYNDPQNTTDAKYYVEAINACMNRNRDNNGNGKIDADELRWYVPATGKYLRLMLGDESLTEPLINFKSITKLPRKNGNSWSDSEGEIKNDYYTRYMFGASNIWDGSIYVLWTIEGLSTSSWEQAKKWGGGYPWQVRCIRNLGTDLTKIESNDGVTKAYKFDGNARTIEMTYYDPRSVRQTACFSNGPASEEGVMPIHNITSPYNMPYKKFEYAPDDIEIPDASWQLTALNKYIESNPCKIKDTATKSGWRVPNQKEIAILKNEGLHPGNSVLWLSCTYSYFNTVTGVGDGYVNGENMFFGMFDSKGMMLTEPNLHWYGYKGRVRCVRDVP